MTEHEKNLAEIAEKGFPDGETRKLILREAIDEEKLDAGKRNEIKRLRKEIGVLQDRIEELITDQTYWGDKFKIDKVKDEWVLYVYVKGQHWRKIKVISDSKRRNIEEYVLEMMVELKKIFEGGERKNLIISGDGEWEYDDWGE